MRRKLTIKKKYESLISRLLGYKLNPKEISAGFIKEDDDHIILGYASSSVRGGVGYNTLIDIGFTKSNMDFRSTDLNNTYRFETLIKKKPF